MRRLIASFGILTLFPTLVLGVAAPGAAAQGNAESAHLCHQGGFQNYTDAAGNPFKNAGQCTRYAAQGGQLVPVVVGPAPSLTVVWTVDDGSFTGVLTGAGLEPGAEVVATITTLDGLSFDFFRGTTVSPSGTVDLFIGHTACDRFNTIVITAGNVIRIEEQAPC